MARIIQVREIPDDVHERLKVRAAHERRTLSDLVRAELVELAARPTLPEMLELLHRRERVEIEESAADAVRAGRAER